MSYASDKIGNEIVGMSNYGSKTLCPCEACKKKRAAEQGLACKDCGCWIKMGTYCATCFSRKNPMVEQPPAGDVVERMCDVVDNVRRAYDKHAPKGEEARHPGMVAALAIAREGYVSLEYVERIINEFQDIIGWQEGESRNKLIGDIAAKVRNRLAKPAERVTDRVTWSQCSNGAALVRLDGNDVAIFYKGPYDIKYANECAERYAAALREEFKAGKQ